MTILRGAGAVCDANAADASTAAAATAAAGDDAADAVGAWRPSPGPTAAARSLARAESTLEHRNRYARPWRYCATCRTLKPPRAHHCASCGVCQRRMDHHCELTNTCIGLRNHKYFVLWLFYTNILIVYYAGALLARLWYTGWSEGDASGATATRTTTTTTAALGDGSDRIPLTLRDLGTMLFSIVSIYLAFGPQLVIMFLQACVNMARNVTRIEIWEQHVRENEFPRTRHQ